MLCQMPVRQTNENTAKAHPCTSAATISTNLELERIAAGTPAKVAVPDCAVVDVLLSKRSSGCKALLVG